MWQIAEFDPTFVISLIVVIIVLVIVSFFFSKRSKVEKESGGLPGIPEEILARILGPDRGEVKDLPKSEIQRRLVAENERIIDVAPLSDTLIDRTIKCMIALIDQSGGYRRILLALYDAQGNPLSEENLVININSTYRKFQMPPEVLKLMLHNLSLSQLVVVRDGNVMITDEGHYVAYALHAKNREWAKGKKPSQPEARAT